MVLLLHNHEIRGLMDIADYIDAVEAGYREFGSGNGAAFRGRTSGYVANRAIPTAGICQPAAKPPSNSKRGCCPA